MKSHRVESLVDWAEQGGCVEKRLAKQGRVVSGSKPRGRWVAIGRVVVSGLAFTLGCGDGDATEVLVVGTDTERSTLSFATFNAALGVGLADYPQQRLQALQEVLPTVEADVVCLQEIWDFDAVQAVVEAASTNYPHSYYSVAPAAALAADDGQTGAPCTSNEAAELTQCLTDNCAQLPEQARPLCAVTSCLEAFNSVTETCQDCIVSNQAQEPVTIAQICSSGGAGVASYEEQNGLLLLSALPLSEMQFTPMDSALGDRGVLAARVRLGAEQTREVVCTHITPAFSDIDYVGLHGTWEGEQDYQIDQVLEVALQRAEAGPVAVLGDMNCGPQTELSEGVRPESFEAFSEAGFSSPYADPASGRCTFCSNNPLGGDTTVPEQGAIIDHVLLSGFGGGVSVAAERILDGRIEVEQGGMAVSTSLSDHYGVRVQLTGLEQ